MKTHPALLAASVAACVAVPGAQAVYLNSDGLGQALIFPYYTVQSAGGNAFNTYISIANHNADSKVLKLRFREGRNGKETLSLDVYLAPNDMWTGAIVPSSAEPGAPARLVTADLGCTNPAMPVGGMDFTSAGYSGLADDGAGTGLDRTREGFFEAIEMATLTGSSASAIAHNAGGTPANCGTVQVTGVSALAVAAPTGGLSGTVTLINVDNGMDFSVNADALAGLTTRSMYRPSSDPTPVDFNAPEIDMVSQVTANGFLYRSLWSRPVDAVSAAIMRSTWDGEVILDAATRSQTDAVITFPTRQNYVTPTSVVPPFSSVFHWLPDCTPGRSAGELVSLTVFNRESLQVLPPQTDFESVPSVGTLCPAAAVVSLAAAGTSGPTSKSRALGSVNLGFGGTVFLSSSYQDGWFTFGPASGFILSSLGNSTRMNLATGEIVVGSHSYRGLPVTGFWVRTFDNGTLVCAGAICQGNYGSAFPLTYKRSITP